MTGNDVIWLALMPEEAIALDFLLGSEPTLKGSILEAVVARLKREMAR